LAGWAYYAIANRSAIDEAKQQSLAKGEVLITLIQKEYHLKE